MKTTITAKALNNKLAKIAAKDLDIETLERRWLDELDFYELPVWMIKQALESAYKAGLEDATKGFGVLRDSRTS